MPRLGFVPRELMMSAGVADVCRMLLSAINTAALPLVAGCCRCADVGNLLLYIAVVSSAVPDVGWAIAADVGYYRYFRCCRCIIYYR
jgi:hypothetical protein